jgi:choline dehydrogenase-like flavoprotein
MLHCGRPIPLALVRVENNFLADPDDLVTLREGFRLAQEIAHQQPVDAFRGSPLAPGSEVKTAAQIEDRIRNAVITVTIHLGPVPWDAVLDADSNVRGIEAPRMVDAAALPDRPSAHINAIVMMLVERASDLIRDQPPLVPAHLWWKAAATTTSQSTRNVLQPARPCVGSIGPSGGNARPLLPRIDPEVFYSAACATTSFFH